MHAKEAKGAAIHSLVFKNELSHPPHAQKTTWPIGRAFKGCYLKSDPNIRDRLCLCSELTSMQRFYNFYAPVFKVCLICFMGVHSPFVVGASLVWEITKNENSIDGSSRNKDVCHSLLKRLNLQVPLRSVNAVGEREAIDDCAYKAATSLPEFQTPPWIELNPSLHRALVLKLFLFRNSVGTYFSRFDSQPFPISLSDKLFFESNKSIAEQFEIGGGRFFVLNKPLLNIIQDSSSSEASTGRTLARLVWSRPEAPHSSDVCPTLSKHGDTLGLTAFVTEDLSEIDEGTKGVAFRLLSAELRYYKENAYFVHRGFKSIVLSDVELGKPSSICVLSYK